VARGRVAVEVIETTPATTSRSDCVFVEYAKEQVVVPGPLAGNPHLVEAGGQHIPRLSKRAGLCLHPRRSCERVDAERVI
jgi:hypothetical protein